MVAVAWRCPLLRRFPLPVPVPVPVPASVPASGLEVGLQVLGCPAQHNVVAVEATAPRRARVGAVVGVVAAAQVVPWQVARAL